MVEDPEWREMSPAILPGALQGSLQFVPAVFGVINFNDQTGGMYRAGTFQACPGKGLLGCPDSEEMEPIHPLPGFGRANVRRRLIRMR
jgi:hypothetical protein